MVHEPCGFGRAWWRWRAGPKVAAVRNVVHGIQSRAGAVAFGVVYDDRLLLGIDGLWLRVQGSLGVEEWVDTLSGFAGNGYDFIPVLFAESRDVVIDPPLHATFDVGAEVVVVRHDAGLIGVVREKGVASYEMKCKVMRKLTVLGVMGDPLSSQVAPYMCSRVALCLACHRSCGWPQMWTKCRRTFLWIVRLSWALMWLSPRGIQSH